MKPRSMDRRSATSDARPDRRSLRLIHGTIAYAALIGAFPLALIGGMALVGELSPPPWVRIAVPAVLLLVLPLLLAERLLPRDPNARKPGLVRDVLAGTYTGASLLLLGLATLYTAGPLRAEATRLDEGGWARAAYLARWMAGPEHLDADASVLASDTLAPAPEAPKDSASSEVALESDPVETKTETETDLAPSLDPSARAPGSEAPASTAAPKAAREYGPAELFTTYAPTVVAITTGHRGFRSGGTGFFIDGQGTIATNHHVIEDASEVRVKTLAGVEFERVELLVSDPEADLALLRIDPSELGDQPPRVELGDSERVRVGEAVSVIGNPLGLEHTLTNGIISARRVYEGKRYIQMSAPISPGNSGGPVFDRHGQVIAVSVATMYGGQNLNLAVPVSQLQALIASDYPHRRSFGASSW